MIACMNGIRDHCMRAAENDIVEIFRHFDNDFS